MSSVPPAICMGFRRKIPVGNTSSRDEPVGSHGNPSEPKGIPVVARGSPRDVTGCHGNPTNRRDFPWGAMGIRQNRRGYPAGSHGHPTSMGPRSRGSPLGTKADGSREQLQSRTSVSIRMICTGTFHQKFNQCCYRYVYQCFTPHQAVLFTRLGKGTSTTYCWTVVVCTRCQYSSIDGIDGVTVPAAYSSLARLRSLIGQQQQEQ